MSSRSRKNKTIIQVKARSASLKAKTMKGGQKKVGGVRKAGGRGCEGLKVSEGPINLNGGQNKTLLRGILEVHKGRPVKEGTRGFKVRKEKHQGQSFPFMNRRVV